MATPSGHRRKDVFDGLPTNPQPPTMTRPEIEEIPPSSGLRVPASTLKQAQDTIFSSTSKSRRKRNFATMDQTPTRGPLKHSQSDLGNRLNSFQISQD